MSARAEAEKRRCFLYWSVTINRNKALSVLGQEPINQFSLFSWRSQIGYVSQESPIVVGTIRDNICYGMDKKVDQADIERVAKMAYADQFISELPNGYDTEVGERGMKLSGGQRQRIAIARAFLRDPKILMLDEATSSLDSKSEQVVQQALQNLMKGRTTLVIAHRLSTVIDSDQIIFLDKGKITGSGTHEQLLRTTLCIVNLLSSNYGLTNLFNRRKGMRME